jgi:hypothetical protein
MKTTLKKSLKILMLGSLLTCPIASKASVVKDINQAMTTLLGHAPVVKNVYDGQNQGLDSGAPNFQPWSSSYWPDILGGISNHYRDRTRFGNEFFFLLKYPAARGRLIGDEKNVCDKYETWSPDDLNKKLSPTEKYDLLLGDTNFTFTKNVTAEIDFRANYKKTSILNNGKQVDSDDLQGDNNTDNAQFADVQGTYASFDDQVAYRYWQKSGNSIAYWFGICDGWSPAAVTLPRPVNPVTLVGKLGQSITFYPDDLKALGDYLFARTNNDYMTTMNYQFAGRPCASDGNPPTNDDDSPNPGRVTDFRCNDVDAGVWHLALLNRIGKDKMGFVFEIDNNKKINNHPIASYSLKYFNPITGKEGTLADSVVLRSLVKDSYANRRNSAGTKLVGVKSNFRYLNYQWPEDHKDPKWNTDSPAQDETKTLTYVYDLELDDAGNVLGGEWGDRSKEDYADRADGTQVMKSNYSPQPDFIWMAAPQNLPHSEMSAFTSMGQVIDPSNPRPFGNMNWAWDGNGAHLPDEWTRAAVADEAWQPATIGVASKIAGSKIQQVAPNEAKDSVLKSAQPLSDIVFYLFDKSRDPEQK